MSSPISREAPCCAGCGKVPARRSRRVAREATQAEMARDSAKHRRVQDLRADHLYEEARTLERRLRTEELTRGTRAGHPEVQHLELGRLIVIERQLTRDFNTRDWTRPSGVWFCTKRCAVAFAGEAYLAGARR